jgi:hypothetical protein
MASLPGRTVWQKETGPLALFNAPIPAFASWQYGLSGNGLETFPSASQYRPPFYGVLADVLHGDEQSLTMDLG